MNINLGPAAAWLTTARSRAAGLTPDTWVEELIARNEVDQDDAHPNDPAHEPDTEPQTERDYWLKQLEQAVDELADNATTTPGLLIDAIGWAEGANSHARSTSLGVYIRELGIPTTKTRKGTGLRAGDIRATAAAARQGVDREVEAFVLDQLGKLSRRGGTPAELHERVTRRFPEGSCGREQLANALDVLTQRAQVVMVDVAANARYYLPHHATSRLMKPTS